MLPSICNSDPGDETDIRSPEPTLFEMQEEEAWREHTAERITQMSEERKLNALDVWPELR